MIQIKKQFEAAMFRVKLEIRLTSENGWRVQMFRPCCSVLVTLLLSGCAVIEQFRSSPGSGEMPTQNDSYQEEKQSLFEQPYIDPLTDYLIEYQGDESRKALLADVRHERDKRCEEVAREYVDEPATWPALQRYNISYAYSCPQQVSAFEERVERKLDEPESEPAPDPETVNDRADVTSESEVSDQNLSDCYLLTSIRNFSEAREVCRELAENGDVRSQANMAVIAYAFEDYPTALRWAKKAAPFSGEAAFLLGQMYAAGHGVSQNLDLAVYWYKEAARQGHKEGQAIFKRRSGGRPAGDI